MSESHADRISRVETMSTDTRGHTWDLSRNDTTALKAVLRDRETLLAALKDLLAALRDLDCLPEEGEEAEKIGTQEAAAIAAVAQAERQS